MSKIQIDNVKKVINPMEPKFAHWPFLQWRKRRVERVRSHQRRVEAPEPVA